MDTLQAIQDFTRIVDGKRYSTSTSTPLAADKHGTYFLFRTAKGALFTVRFSQSADDWDILTPISEDRAMRLYAGQLGKHGIPFKDAFPDAEVVDA